MSPKEISHDLVTTQVFLIIVIIVIVIIIVYICMMLSEGEVSLWLKQDVVSKTESRTVHTDQLTCGYSTAHIFHCMTKEIKVITAFNQNKFN